MGRPFKCPYCGASENVSKGVRRTKTMGPRRIFRCKRCKRKFTPRHQQAGAPAADTPGQPTAGPAAPTAAEP